MYYLSSFNNQVKSTITSLTANLSLPSFMSSVFETRSIPSEFVRLANCSVGRNPKLEGV